MFPQSQILKIIVTSDLHGQIAYQPAKKQPGLARFLTYLNNLRKSGPVILLDLGDLLSGSVYGAFDRGRTLASLVGRLGYRGLLPGNHDFDYSPEEREPLYYFKSLIPLVKAAGSPELEVLGLNLHYQNKPISGVLNKPLILKASTPRIAVLGVLNPLTHRPSLGTVLNGFDFGLKDTLARTKKDLLAELTRELLAFSPQDHIIILSHLGAPDRPGQVSGLAGQLDLDFDNNLTGPDLAGLPNVSLVIDGHSHEVIRPHRINGRARYANLGQGLTAAAEITYEGNGPLRLDLIDWSSLSALPPDLPTQKEIEKIEAALGLNEILLSLPTNCALYGLKGIWETITPLGQFIAEALAMAAEADFSFLNKGALRAGLAGPVTVGSLHEVLPFNDRLLRTQISGRTVKDLFKKWGLKGFKGFPLYYGLELWAYIDDSSYLPLGEETIRLAGLTADGRPLEDDRLYSLALSGQMVRLLTGAGVQPGDRLDCGRILEAVLALLRKRAGQTFLHNPLDSPYRLFVDRAAAEKAFGNIQMST
ncbi:MAG: 5'-nucleotidase C-terminal domain-containing protein [Deltaproteobacteria bacterium]|jgi:2',3'-cyclic-nucleotide 2'-phosphodiesterase (5'-nucleotidase family)|nr:5'-nucleotidase C-terminal domain-containing protein [Deltaproteobacteria bacterium]